MSTDSPEFKAASEDAWKEHVRAENAELNRQGGSPAQPGTVQTAPQNMPPADFPGLVDMLTTQAMVALGLIPHPASGKPDPQVRLARHFIDLLGVIESKTAGNLSSDETALLGGTLHYLRMTYIEISKRSSDPKN